MKLSKKQKIRFLIYILVFGGLAIYRYFHFANVSEISPGKDTVKYEVRYLWTSDGDTATFQTEDGSEVSCRFLAVDTPEIEEEGYEEAKEYTRMALRKASRIILELDPQSDMYDKFDRLLAWVWVDGELLQAKLIREGLAQIRYLYEDYLYTDYLYKIQREKE